MPSGERGSCRAFFGQSPNVHKPREYGPFACERQVAAGEGSAGASPSRDRVTKMFRAVERGSCQAFFGQSPNVHKQREYGPFACERQVAAG